MKPRSNTNSDFLKALAASPVAKLNQHLLNTSNNSSSSKKPKNKYNAVKVEFDGHTFDSQKECNRYVNLRAMVTAGIIKDLLFHVVYRLESSDTKVCDYEADFVYTDVRTGETIVEDVKSPATRRVKLYRLKKKMMLAQYKIQIKEV